MPSAASAIEVRPRARLRKVNIQLLGGLLLPLFFAVLFPLAFTSASHAPKPLGMDVLIVGPDQVVGDIADQLNSTDSFDVSTTDAVDEAESSVAERRVVGSIQVSPVQSADAEASTTPAFSVTAYVAGAGGNAAAGTVTATAQQIAEQLGTTASVKDVVPLAERDPLGVNLFFPLVYMTMAAYMVVIILGQVADDFSFRARWVAVAVAAVVGPIVVFGLTSIFTGDYGASFSTFVATFGVGSLYMLVIGAAALLFQQLLGPQIQYGVMGLLVFMNFPSAGGIMPASMLPAFWQGVHDVYFGAGAFEAIRSIVYFDGHGASRWIAQLAAWLLVFLAANVILYLARRLRAARSEVAALRATHQRHGAESDADVIADKHQPHALTGALRPALPAPAPSTENSY